MNDGPMLASPRPATGFVFVGDFGTGGEAEADVSSAIRTWVDDPPPSTRWSRSGTTFTAMEVRLVSTRHGPSPTGWVEDARVPVVASLGNHDIETANGGPVMDLFDMPNRWYERRVGPVDVFVLDSNDLEEEGQMAWLSTALASSSAPWQVLVFHHPVYSCGKHGSTPRVQRELLPIVAIQGVDLVVNGHDHNYQRFAPVNGTTYVVSGGGGRHSTPSATAQPTRPTRSHGTTTFTGSSTSRRRRPNSSERQYRGVERSLIPSVCNNRTRADTKSPCG